MNEGVAHMHACRTSRHVYTQLLTRLHVLRTHQDGGIDKDVAGWHLDHYGGFNFWRFDLSFELLSEERKIKYLVEYGTKKTDMCATFILLLGPRSTRSAVQCQSLLC